MANHSITSSARTSSVGGVSIPSALAENGPQPGGLLPDRALIEGFGRRNAQAFDFLGDRGGADAYNPTKLLIAAMKASGCSSGGQWPQPGNST